jgi:hypothetical protein
MVLPVFQRATERLLARIGEEALLRGTVTCRVHIEFGVEMQGEHGDVAYERIVATMPRALAPRQGDALVVGAASYTVDSPPFADNGATVRVVLR